MSVLSIYLIGVAVSIVFYAILTYVEGKLTLNNLLFILFLLLLSWLGIFVCIIPAIIYLQEKYCDKIVWQRKNRDSNDDDPQKK